MTKLEITQDREIYTYNFTFADGSTKHQKYTALTHEAIKDYFSKPKKEKKKPADAPTLEEVKEYFKKEGYQEQTAIRFYKYYDSMDWYDANNKPVLRWKSKAISTWFKPENKLKEEIKSKSKFFE